MKTASTRSGGPTGGGGGGPIGGGGGGPIGGGGSSAAKLKRIARQFKNLSDLFEELAKTPIGGAAKKKK